MSVLDGWLEGAMLDSGVWMILLVSLALGLRHATDPDHLAAVTILIASETERNRAGRAASIGLSWGLGHGTTLVLLGFPLVLLGRALPETVQKLAEAVIGGIIVLLAVRLLVWWRRGLFRVHAHSHGGGAIHRHVHSHGHEKAHDNIHAQAHRVRTAISSYGIGSFTGSGDRAGLRCSCSRPSRIRRRQLPC